MNITTDPYFYNRLADLTYSRQTIVMSLTDRISSASNIDELGRYDRCGKPDAYFVYDRVCKVYFVLLERNRVKLLDFRLARDGRMEG